MIFYAFWLWVFGDGGFEESEKRVSFVAVDFKLFELVELGFVAKDAEIMDFVVGARGLMTELVAGEVEDFETLSVVFFVKGFEAFVLRSEATAGGGVDDEEDFTF